MTVRIQYDMDMNMMLLPSMNISDHVFIGLAHIRYTDFRTLWSQTFIRTEWHHDIVTTY